MPPKPADVLYMAPVNICDKDEGELTTAKMQRLCRVPAMIPGAADSILWIRSDQRVDVKSDGRTWQSIRVVSVGGD